MDLSSTGRRASNHSSRSKLRSSRAKMKGNTSFLLISLVAICTISVITVILWLPSWERTDPPPVEKYVLQKSSGILGLQTDVALSITKKVLLAELEQSSSPSKNAVLSPASIQAVLSLVATGSKGATRDQLLSFLKANSSDQLDSLSSELVSVISDSKFSRLLFGQG